MEINRLIDLPIQIIDGDRGQNYPSAEDLLASGYCLFLNAKNVTSDGFDFSSCQFISAEKDLLLRKGRLQRGDIVLTTRGTVGNVAYFNGTVPYDNIRINSGMVIFRPDPLHISSEYLYFVMRSNDFKGQIQSYLSGSAQPQLPIRDINNLCIAVPPLSEQHAIARILGGLEDMIILNGHINKTLERLAHTLFKSWFVDFDPVRAKMAAKVEGRDAERAAMVAISGKTDDELDTLHRDTFCSLAQVTAYFPDTLVDSILGKIPADWEVAMLDDIVNVVDCLHSKKPERIQYGRPLLQLDNIRDDGLIDTEETYWISEEDYRNWTSRMEASPGDCVITNVGRVGAVAQIPDGLYAALGRNMTGLRCKPSFPFPAFLIECLLSTAMREEIERKKDTGTILDALNVRNIPTLRFVLPSAPLLKAFESYSRPIRELMERNMGEIRTLASIRDALLPKLLSGELQRKEISHNEEEHRLHARSED